MFAQTFREKWNLPRQVTNFYSFEASSPLLSRHGLLQLRTRDGRYYLSSLDVTSATGPDGLSTILLHQLSHILCFPFTLLARRIVHTGKWPLAWTKHWICPLFKRNSRFLASNYRGLQITSQMSKAMERFLGVHFLTHLSVSGAFGTSQFAYRKYHGARDAVLYVTLVWLLAFAHGRKVGTYCSDVSSAFDRVDSEILLAKLRRSNVHPSLVAVISNWLFHRSGEVVVQKEYQEGEKNFHSDHCVKECEKILWKHPRTLGLLNPTRVAHVGNAGVDPK